VDAWAAAYLLVPFILISFLCVRGWYFPAP
jgi:hypothetical protein